MLGHSKIFNSSTSYTRLISWGIVSPSMRAQILQTRFAIRRSKPGLGYGLFATNAIPAGEFVLEYKGRHVPTETADKLKTKYLFEIDSSWTIDGSTRANTARYVNHSCAPNCEADVRDGKVLIFANREIEAGEELTIDYGEEYFKEFIEPHGCKCDRCKHPRLAFWRRS
ncbi:MAG: histone-lysine N-methyltransferase [Parcubacteria group bacterium Gr01-1014_8]|nr:MAG: histone-lysine N-methyltransferase [Parcubacteria group bacterium Gr01-1014_8]